MNTKIRTVEIRGFSASAEIEVEFAEGDEKNALQALNHAYDGAVKRLGMENI